MIDGALRRLTCTQGVKGACTSLRGEQKEQERATTAVTMTTGWERAAMRVDISESQMKQPFNEKTMETRSGRVEKRKRSGTQA
eukprot:4984010-Pleurochrysis_carterae.AAC.2